MTAVKPALFDADRPAPPGYLAPGEKSTWRTIIATFPPEQFHAADQILLAQYCQAVEAVRAAAAALRKDGPVQTDRFGKTSPSGAAQAFNGAARVAGSLAGKLRLSPVSRLQKNDTRERADVAAYDIPTDWTDPALTN